ncbi:MAG: YbhB/YbcL family Raf kinase inhibitor-like protein [Pseudomonadota bacterium]
MKLRFPITACALLAGMTNPAAAQQGDGTKLAIPISIFKPAKIEATSERIASLKAPAGFTVSVFAKDLKNARILAVAPNGTVYLSRRDQGDVLMLRDADGDGRADAAPVVVASRAGMHGLAVRENKLYMITVKEVFVADIQSDGRLGTPKMIIGDLPDSGQHPNRTIAFGPDGMLYISVGSTCNACIESNPENATLLRASPDGLQRTIYASGLRNTIGFGWHPRTGELWGMDHGIDFLGDDQQPEELNRIEQGKQYGWPHVFAGGEIYPVTTPAGGISKEEWKARSAPMTTGYTAHAAPMQMVFYRNGSFPAEYNGDAFVAMRGSWNRQVPSGYEIARVRFVDGRASKVEPFVTGFLTDDGQQHIARPVGLAQTTDGALLMADDANGVIYRVAFTGKAATAAASAPMPLAISAAGSTEQPKPLAKDRPETRAEGKLTVRSTSFKVGAPLPARLSEYADGVSPALTWDAVPGAKSYAVIMEDPDAEPKPFVHWLAWNIPGNVTSLPEGLQEQARLTEPEGVLQGSNTRGTVGYYGPRPPPGDKAHRYHIQVLALDLMPNVPFGSQREQLMTAIKGHVLAKGELVGSYKKTSKPEK